MTAATVYIVPIFGRPEVSSMLKSGAIGIMSHLSYP